MVAYQSSTVRNESVGEGKTIEKATSGTAMIDLLQTMDLEKWLLVSRRSATINKYITFTSTSSLSSFFRVLPVGCTTILDY